MQSKKMLITIISMSVTFIAIVTALVIVLVSGWQGAKSNVTLKFNAVDVACEIKASYTKVVNQLYNDFVDMGSKVVINESTTTAEISPEKDIILDKYNARVVFKYEFRNTMNSDPMYIELTNIPNMDEANDPEVVPELFENVKLLYYNTYNYSGDHGKEYGYSGLFSGAYDDELSTTMGKLVLPAQCVKFVYSYKCG